MLGEVAPSVAGEAASVEDASIKVERNLSTAASPVSFVVGTVAMVEVASIKVERNLSNVAPPFSLTVGEAAIVAEESTKVEGKLSTLIAPCSFTADGGGMSISPILRFLPLGAGSKGGDLLYVTVLVMTDRTLTDLGQALLGVSKYRREALSRL